MNTKKYILSIMMLLMGISTSYAQHRISGNVSDEIEPLMMVNVVERDANNRIVAHAQTDLNGDFSMVVVNPKDFLEVTYVGYKPYKVQIGSQTRFNIVLEEVGAIQEVVITARRRQESSLRRPTVRA